MRTVWMGALTLLALTTVSCADAPTPLTPHDSATPAAALGAALERDGVIEAPLALYTLTIDPASLSATATLKETRRVQATDDVYLLSIDSFLRPESFRVRSVSVDGGNLALTYSVTHPFPAPENPEGAPNGFSNRADLGIAGRVLFLVDVATAVGNSYFGGGGDPVVLNTELVANADAYYRPAGLLDLALTANTFPYKVLVDETGLDGSREGVSNGGAPTGNYGADGWTRTEFGFDNDNWTGYGVLHQGQTSVSTLHLDLAALSSGPTSLDVAILAKYNDPRGGNTGAEKKANRLPPLSPDPALFGYRMPHGALDVEGIAFAGESGGFLPDAISASTLSFHVTDWDARATESGFADLDQDPTVTAVAIGESGAPGLAVCIPGVLGDSTVVETFDVGTDLLDDDSSFGGDPGQDSGHPGDALFYSRSVTKTVTSGQGPGTFTGLVQAIDPEEGLATDWKFALDPTLTPLAVNRPAPITYQAFQVNMALTIGPEAGWAYSPTGNATVYPYGLTVDFAGNTIVTGYYSYGLGPGPLNFGGGPLPNGGASDLYIVKLDLAGNYVWQYYIAAASAQQIVEVVTDSAGNVYGGGFMGGTVNLGGGNRTSAGGNDILLVKLNSAGVYQWDRLWGSSSGTDNTRGLAIDNADNILLVGSFGGATDFGGGLRTNTGSDSVVIKVDSNGVYQWDKPLSGAGSDFFYAGATDNAGNIYVSGYFTTTADYGLGAVASNGANDVPVLKISNAGVLLWDKRFGGSSSEWGWDIAVDPLTQGPVVAGYTQSTAIDFGGGIRVLGTGDKVFVTRFTSAGFYEWDKTFESTGGMNAYAVEVDPNGAIYVGGAFAGSVDFGGGLRTSNGSDDGFITRLTPLGNWVWDITLGGTSIEDVDELALSPTNSLRASGVHLSATDFDPGPGTFILPGEGNDAWVGLYNTVDGLW